MINQDRLNELIKGFDEHQLVRVAIILRDNSDPALIEKKIKDMRKLRYERNRNPPKN